jgi:hypothetical protein
MLSHRDEAVNLIPRSVADPPGDLLEALGSTERDVLELAAEAVMLEAVGVGDDDVDAVRVNRRDGAETVSSCAEKPSEVGKAARIHFDLLNR